MRRLHLATTIVIALSVAPAWGDERDYCPARPGLGTPACTIAPGRVSVETGLADWTRDDTLDAREDSVLYADTLVRIGITDILEAEIGLTPYGTVRSRDKASGAVAREGGIGDLFLGAKVNLRNPDGSGFSIAALPFATVPTGGSALGAGDWGAGFLLPMSVDIGHSLNLQLTPEVDAAVNGNRAGRHLAYSAILGLGFPVLDELSGTIEVQGLQDDDPAGPSTQAFASVSLAWFPRPDLQLDVGAVAGLNRDSADVELYLGVSRRF
ncbi:MAG: transporter [Sphingomonas sp.]|nr:transporter [Sphingomonas sp.]